MLDSNLDREQHGAIFNPPKPGGPAETFVPMVPRPPPNCPPPRTVTTRLGCSLDLTLKADWLCVSVQGPHSPMITWDL